MSVGETVRMIARDLLRAGVVSSRDEAKKYAVKIFRIILRCKRERLGTDEMHRLIDKLFESRDRGEYGFGGDWWKGG
jgi:hypothetical protein